MHDPENKAESWESPQEASPSSVSLSIVCLPGWMPPTLGRSEVEAVPPSPEERSPGTLTLLQQAKLLRLRRKKVTENIGLAETYFRSKLIKKKEQKQAQRTNNQRASELASEDECCFPTSLLSKLLLCN